MVLNNDREGNCTGYIMHDEHIDTNTPIVLLPLYEEGNYEELVESDIGGSIMNSQPVQGLPSLEPNLDKWNRKYWTRNI